jgi:hypothetical protein
VLALLGGTAGLLFARWTLVSMASLLPAEVVESLGFGLDGTAVAFSMALAVVTGFVFGLFPALHSTRPDLVSTLKAQAGQPSGARGAAWFRNGLVTAQIALSMALLVSAGLFVKSLMNVSRIDLGRRHRQRGDVPDLARAERVRAAACVHAVRTGRAGAAALPGVTGVGMSMVPLLAGSNWGSDVSVEGFERGPIRTRTRGSTGQPGILPYARRPPDVGPRVHGRRRRAGAPRVAIVNEAFTRKFNLGRDAVGKRMAQGGGTDLDIEIVGVVQDAKYSEVKQEIPPLFFLPYAQAERMGSLSFYLRTALGPEQMISSVQSAMSRLDPNLPLEDLKTMPQQVRENIFLDRMISTLSAARSRCWRPCSRPSGSTACWPTPSRSGRASSGCGWRSAPTAGACAGSCCARSGS